MNNRELLSRLFTDFLISDGFPASAWTERVDELWKELRIKQLKAHQRPDTDKDLAEHLIIIDQTKNAAAGVNGIAAIVSQDKPGKIRILWSIGCFSEDQYAPAALEGPAGGS